MAKSTRSITFAGNYSNLAKIAAFVREAAEASGFDDLAIYMVETAVDEACSNIIEHAYGGEGIGNIQITCINQPGKLTVELQDQGTSFDPELIPTPDFNLPLEERSDHGLGLFFMRKFMDEVYFEKPDSGGNKLTMIKRKREQAK